MKKFYFLLLIIITGCSKDDPAGDNYVTQLAEPSYQTELVSELNSFLNSFYPGTKSSDYGIRKVITLTSEGQTKSYDYLSDTIMHIMDFVDGYAVFGHRMPHMEILAFAEKGDLDLSVFENVDFEKYLSRRPLDEESEQALENEEDDAFNDMTEDEFKTFLSEMILSASLRMKEEYEMKKESDFIIDLNTEYQIEVFPMIFTKWKQGAPFNDYMVSQRGKYIAAGCGNIALGQFIVYHNHPKFYYEIETEQLKRVYYC
ncbi:MAG: C10 family peptidase [Rikenellaceae bacterium]|nr:C10 family peptidase [Rikenellaceae bacterium]